MALVATGIALVITLLLPSIFVNTPFLLFFGAVAVTAWFGGYAPGILASLLSLFLVHQFVLGEVDGPVPFHYAAPDYRQDMLRGNNV